MDVIVGPQAKKYLRKLPKTFQIIIAEKLKKLGKKNGGRSEKLGGYKDIYRVRVGNYRIVYKQFKNRIYIVLIGHRKEVYNLLRNLLK